jgi:hypothetical protein
LLKSTFGFKKFILTYYFYSKSNEREEAVDEFDLPLTQLLYVISRHIGWLFFAEVEVKLLKVANNISAENCIVQVKIIVTTILRSKLFPLHVFSSKLEDDCESLVLCSSSVPVSATNWAFSS